MKKLQLVILALVSFAMPSTAATVLQLFSPSEFSRPQTTLNFEGHANQTSANTLYAAQGVSFSAGATTVRIMNWSDLGRTTTSPTNVLSTSGNPYAHYLDAIFAEPRYEVGVYFGNDQNIAGAFGNVTLSIYDAQNVLMGSVVVVPNLNTSVDQFIGLRSDVAFYRAHFEHGTANYSVALDDFSFNSVPEPSRALLLCLGCSLMLARRRPRASRC